MTTKYCLECSLIVVVEDNVLICPRCKSKLQMDVDDYNQQQNKRR